MKEQLKATTRRMIPILAQIWAAMLTHLVLRYIKWKNKVVSSYTRFAAIAW